ncbi:hypothetical protein HJFPF1_09797 [Paramyrothecium foliicola]|nr:hypothetical protein HJFPF1_09797 [Paramyrothecium foliicola]
MSALLCQYGKRFRVVGIKPPPVTTPSTWTTTASPTLADKIKTSIKQLRTTAKDSTGILLVSRPPPEQHLGHGRAATDLLRPFAGSG